MYKRCRKSSYDPAEIFGHVEKLINEAQKRIIFLNEIEPHINKYNGKQLNARLEKYLTELLPNHYRIRTYNHYGNYILIISILYDEENRRYHQHEVTLGNIKDTRQYNHENYLTEIEKTKEKLSKYGESFDKINSAVMKYNIAYKYLEEADNELYNVVPEMYSYDDRNRCN